MADLKQKFYVTTPIYYVNARPHIGHAYTTIVADVLARRHRLLGDDTFFLTGTDEHGQKIERSAAAAGIPPQQFADEVSAAFRSLWDRMGITYNDYIRTTEPRHAVGAQQLFTTLYDRGFIYLDTYTGAYCVSDEAFVDVQAGEPCPECGRITEIVTEENFFFKLSAFQLPLLNLIESGELKIENEARRNEVLSFLRGDIRDAFFDVIWDSGEEALKRQGKDELARERGYIKRTAPSTDFPEGSEYVPGALKDLSISRSSFTWGIPVPEAVEQDAGAKQKHVIYVWLDALANYMTAIGYGADTDAALTEEQRADAKAKFEKYWPADLHLVGKEIIRFHCVYWPAFLLAADLPLPKAITAHGWLLFDNSKMSKSKGNIVRTETILDAFGDHVYGKQFPDSSKAERDLFASDVLRYFLLREIPFGQDGTFSFEALVTRYNADLANGYGNLVSRTLSMIAQNAGSVIPPPNQSFIPKNEPWTSRHEEIRDLSADIAQGFGPEPLKRMAILDEEWLRVNFAGILNSLGGEITRVDSYLAATKPWKLAKDVSSSSELEHVLYTATESIRIITALLYPVLPRATAKVWQQLGLGDIELAARNGELTNLEWGDLQPGTKLGPLAPIFPRADKELIDIMTDTENNAAPNNAARPNAPLASASTPAPAAPVPADSTDPGAPPRSFSETANAVAGSSAITTRAGLTPSHTEATPSAAFATTAAHTPITAAPADSAPQITIDDFARVELRIAQVLVAERIPKADKLLRIEVDLGLNAAGEPEKRQILSGIAEHYAPEELVGKRIIVITNLAPRKMRGLESHGMLLAASEEDGKPYLATVPDGVPIGTRLK